MARNPKPIQLDILQGNPNNLTKAEIDKRVKAEESLNFKADKVKAPAQLSAVGRKAFKHLVQEFEGSALLKNVDVYSLYLFCDAFANYVECSRVIEEDGLTITGSRSAEAGIVAHPLMAKKIQLAGQMEKQMSKLGLSPVDRGKLIQAMQQPEEEEDDEFGGAL